MLPPKTAHTTLQIHHRYRQAIGGGKPYQGLPQGHPMAAAVATLTLDKILKETRASFAANASTNAFADDMTMVAQDHSTADELVAHMGAALSRYGVQLNPTKTRWAQPRRGGSMQYLGYHIDWPDGGSGPRIRPTDRAYYRLAERLRNCIGPNMAAEVIRGWMEAYRLTNDPGARNELNALVRSAQWHPNNLAKSITHHAPVWEDNS